MMQSCLWHIPKKPDQNSQASVIEFVASCDVNDGDADCPKAVATPIRDSWPLIRFYCRNLDTRMGKTHQNSIVALSTCRWGIQIESAFWVGLAYWLLLNWFQKLKMADRGHCECSLSACISQSNKLAIKEMLAAAATTKVPEAAAPKAAPHPVATALLLTLLSLLPVMALDISLPTKPRVTALWMLIIRSLGDAAR